MTRRTKNKTIKEKKVPRANAAQPDPRMVSLVRLLARHAAQQDFARYAEQSGKAHQPDKERKG